MSSNYVVVRTVTPAEVKPYDPSYQGYDMGLIVSEYALEGGLGAGRGRTYNVPHVGTLQVNCDLKNPRLYMQVTDSYSVTREMYIQKHGDQWKLCVGGTEHKEFNLTLAQAKKIRAKLEYKVSEYPTLLLNGIGPNDAGFIRPKAVGYVNMHRLLTCGMDPVKTVADA